MNEWSFFEQYSTIFKLQVLAIYKYDAREFQAEPPMSSITYTRHRWAEQVESSRALVPVAPCLRK